MQNSYIGLMAPRRAWCFILTVFSFFLSSSGASNFSGNSLNSIIRDRAFKVLIRPRTGVLYEVPLPANFSGMEASVVRLRSGSFWTRGANFSVFRIPPRTMPMPYVRRLAIVYQNLGNWSSSYYSVPGHSLVSPVVGLLAYDASAKSSFNGVRELDLKVSGDPISVIFPQIALPKGMNSTTTTKTTKCARFESDGSVHLGEMASSNACSMTSPGHFTIVVPSVTPRPPSAEPTAATEKEGEWRVWVIACGGGVIGLVLVGLVGMGIFVLVKKKRMEEMEIRGEEGEVLRTVWVGGSKMPSATMIRTQPVLENGNAP